jgi:hypothetical protein
MLIRTPDLSREELSFLSIIHQFTVEVRGGSKKLRNKHVLQASWSALLAVPPPLGRGLGGGYILTLDSVL